MQCDSQSAPTPVPADRPYCPLSTPCADPTTDEVPARYSNRERVSESVREPREFCHVLYQNVGGINSSIDKYMLATSCSSYDVVAFTETWLNGKTISSQVFNSDYTVFRCDRSPLNSMKSSGGGVLLAVKYNLPAVLIDDESWHDLELVWVRIDLKFRKLYLCVVYLPPDRTRDTVLAESFARCLSKVCSAAAPQDDIVVVGDFNMPGIKWCGLSPAGFSFPDPIHSRLSDFSNTILDSLSTATLRQINSVENENGRMLDLCFVNETNQPPIIERAPAPLVNDIPHHPALLLSFEIPRPVDSELKASTFHLDFKNSDYEAIFQILDSIDWDSELGSLDPNAAADKFTHILNYTIDRHVPKRNQTSRHQVPWFTRDLRRLRTLKKKALRSYSKSKSPCLKDQYRKLNSAYKKASQLCYQRYLSRLQRNLKIRPKSFWRYVNDQRKESGLPSCMFLNEEYANSVPEMCNLFAEKFSSTYVTEPVDPQRTASAASNVPLLGTSFANIRIDEAKIVKAATELKGSFSPGPDGIPATFLKRCVLHLLTPIKLIFQRSLEIGTFPSLWKEAYMFPVHKKGDRRDVNNYRGISALCAISKLFELVVLDPLFSYCKNYFSIDQHGYIPKRSTTTNLLEFTSFVQDSFAVGSQTDAIYTDLSAAFDKVNHDITIAKLNRLGFCGSLLEWFRSYLSGRKLTVQLNDSFSYTFSANSGVPQGSHLGPIVFLIYFNDALLLLDGPKVSYADDVKLYYKINGPNDIEFLQQQFNRFAFWCDLNCLPLNCKKCAVISFARKQKPLHAEYFFGNEKIPRVDHIKDLGVILDQQLDFKNHTSYVVDKASRCLGFIFRVAKEFKDVYCLKSLYCSLVRSILEYASAVWCPYYQNGSDRIEGIQRRFIWFALRRLNWQDPLHLPSYENRCRLINLDSLQHRRFAVRALFVGDLLSSRIDCPRLLEDVHLSVRPRGLRDRGLQLHVPLRRNNYGSNSALVGVVRTFNRFAVHFDFNISREVFKNRILSVLR